MKLPLAIAMTSALLGFVSGESIRGIKAESATEAGSNVIEHGEPVMDRQMASCSAFAGYVFWPTYDSTGSDLGTQMNPASVSISSMISACNSNSSCRGVNTNGYMKSSIKPLRLWSKWTTSLCQGLYIKKTPDSSFKVNGRVLTSQEIKYLKWIAQWTIPNFGMSRDIAITRYIAQGTWWSLKELVLAQSNVWNYNLCNTSSGDKIIGPLETCPSGRAWQVGIAAVQVPNPTLANVEKRAMSVYSTTDVKVVLGKSAQQAGYAPGTSTYNSIVASTGDLRKAWLLKAHLVGFYFVADEVQLSA
jgi:hypothetical protein